VVVVTDDLTQRARALQLEDARRFLDELEAPVVVVPGNHDLAPWSSPIERALDPWGRFRRAIGHGAAGPLAVNADNGESAELVVIGLNSADPWRFIEGGVSRQELARVLIEARRHPHAFRVVAAHHPLIETRVRPLTSRVRRHGSVEEILEAADVDLVLTGHLHESFHGPAAAGVGPGRHALVVQASTATSTRVRGHANAWNAIVVDGDPDDAGVLIEVRVARGGRFHTGAVRAWR
jgi:3',5'-cyclic AMP phosphodiesterase CpdA